MSAHEDRFCVCADLSLPALLLIEIHLPSGAPMAQRPGEVVLPICGAPRAPAR